VRIAGTCIVTALLALGASAPAASARLRDCGDVAGDTWTVQGAAPYSGHLWRALAVNVSCTGARAGVAYVALGGSFHHFRGWRCKRRSRYNGACRRTVRRGRRRVGESFGWYADTGRIDAPG